MSDFIKVKKLQDGDSHWYWIPLDEVDQFNQDVRDLSGYDYDDPAEFDYFSDKYEKYRTLGDPDNVPEISLTRSAKSPSLLLVNFCVKSIFIFVYRLQNNQAHYQDLLKFYTSHIYLRNNQTQAG